MRGLTTVSCLFFVVLAFSTSFVFCQNSTDEEVLQKYISLRRKAFDLVESIVKQILPTIISAGYEVDVSSQCLGSLLRLFNGIRNLKLWAISMLDSSGKVTPGITAGSMTDLGDYDLCVNLEDKDRENIQGSFQGQYCTVEITPPRPAIPRHVSVNHILLNVSGLANEDEAFRLILERVGTFYRIPIRAGICVPSTCSRVDLKELFKSALSSLPELDVDVRRCETKKGYEISFAQILVLSCFGILILVTIICTTVDVIMSRRKPHPPCLRHFKHFSFYENTGRFFSKEEGSSGSHLQVLDGVRWWSIVWICLGHTYGLINLPALSRFVNVTEIIKSYPFNVMTNGWVAVDVFFLLGGILVAYSMFGELQRNKGQLNFLKAIFRRLLRLSPALWTVIGIVFLLPWMGSGPLWEEVVTKQVHLCEKSWWLSALYANAWLGHENACLVSSWYVSADLQLYLISPLFIYIFYKSKTYGVLSCLLAITASCVTIFILNMKYDLYPLIMAFSLNTASTEDVFTTVYFRPYAHTASYFVGILLGCYLKTNQKVQVNWVFVLLGWCLSSCMAFLVLLAPYHWHQGDYPTPVVAAMYQAFHKPVFALAVAWVIWACTYGYGGVVTSLLGWHGYKKLSQLVYLIYLTQLPVLWVRIGNFRKVMNFEHYNFFVEFLGVFTISSFLALVLHILVECPFVSLDAAMFPRGHTNKMLHSKSQDNGTSPHVPEEAEKSATLNGIKTNPLITKL